MHAGIAQNPMHPAEPPVLLRTPHANPMIIPYPAPSDPEHINITAINIDALTEAWATVTMPTEIGPNHHGIL